MVEVRGSEERSRRELRLVYAVKSQFWIDRRLSLTENTYLSKLTLRFMRIERIQRRRFDALEQRHREDELGSS